MAATQQEIRTFSAAAMPFPLLCARLVLMSIMAVAQGDQHEPNIDFVIFEVDERLC